LKFYIPLKMENISTIGDWSDPGWIKSKRLSKTMMPPSNNCRKDPQGKKKANTKLISTKVFA
jgi:hypothetical protein